MRKVTVELTVNLELEMEDGLDVYNSINNLNYRFDSETDGMTVTDSRMTGYELVEDEKIEE